MPFIDFQVCNIAIANVGAANEITSLADETFEAEKCSLYLNISREQALEDHPWNFAMKEAPLTLSTTTRTGYAFVYEWPADCVATRAINSDETILYENFVDDAGNTKLIATNVANASLKYTKNITNTTVMPSSFIEAWAWKLSTYIAVPLTGDVRKRDHALEMYINALNSAKRIDSNQGKVETPDMPSWLKVRHNALTIESV